MSEETLIEDSADTMEDGTEAKGKGKSPNAPVARAIARALWLPLFKAANPEAGSPEINAAWKLARQEHTKPVMHALKTLNRRGYTFTAPANDAAEDADTTGSDA